MEIISQAPLQGLNTLALPGCAEFFCKVETRSDLEQALDFSRRQGLPISILGGGSNTVVMKQVPGLVIQVANRGVRLVSEDEHTVHIEAAAGEDWHELVIDSLDSGWYGLENLALIPGCVGAAPIQNIGAYGVELSQFLEAVEVVDISTGEGNTLNGEACQLAYRDSIFKHGLKNRVVIWSIHLKLSKDPSVNLSYPELSRAVSDSEADPKSVANAVIALRQAKLPDPNRIANAGSFFKNPVLSQEKGRQLLESFPEIPHFPQSDGTIKFPAAWLIDRAGWKGLRRGHMGVHPGQALVLVHYGEGDGKELILFSNEIKNNIKEKYDIDLEMEPAVLGV